MAVVPCTRTLGGNGKPDPNRTEHSDSSTLQRHPECSGASRPAPKRKHHSNSSTLRSTLQRHQLPAPKGTYRLSRSNSSCVHLRQEPQGPNRWKIHGLGYGLMHPYYWAPAPDMADAISGFTKRYTDTLETNYAIHLSRVKLRLSSITQREKI